MNEVNAQRLSWQKESQITTAECPYKINYSNLTGASAAETFELNETGSSR